MYKKSVTQVQTVDVLVIQPIAFLIYFLAPGGGGHLGIFWVGMCRPGLQIGTPF